MILKKSIIVCGKICSGKSMVIKFISEQTKWPIVSFGAYIRDVSIKQNLPATREIYQQIGQDLFENWGAKKLLLEVIKFSVPSGQENVLVDGVRHQSVLYEVKRICEQTFVIYLAADEKTRFDRFNSRKNVGDANLSFEDFLKIDHQPIESGIETLSSSADLVIDASRPLQDIYQILRNFLTAWPLKNTTSAG